MSRLGQQEVGHEGVITGRDAFSLRSLICSLQGLICDAESPWSHSVYTPINHCSSYFLLAFYTNV
ncbi:hypothetical protein C3943_11675 [Lysinibacillus sp. B2A1]|nr:hypothetical protein C3943_11675 [Lysinibacillus sp. B2A1]